MTPDALTPRQEMLEILKRTLSDEDAERVVKRVCLRLEGFSHEEALEAYPRVEARLDRDGHVR